ncbi:glycosyltransferase family 4 protein [Synechococcus sp. CB0205]|uniref:glycosyltransferase family 4 protein n=1 Tax=Synechococcus sp. CB0205 TaxID=232363 RepID=UPI0005B9B0D8|nr:glycosyltransferase family 4 protein [Synechococcus sp. CB0205]
MQVLFALHRVGPYHRVRLVAAAQTGLQLTVLQTRPQSQEYPWRFNPAGPYALECLRGAPDPDADPPLAHLDGQLAGLLDRCQPHVIVSVGWADPAYQRLLLAAHRRRIPLVIVSDSRRRDEPRTAAKEWLKRQLLRGYSAAVVAGSESRAYLETLGFPLAAIAQPWDVVDHAFFEAAAAQAGPRQPHFLCVSRFVEKKNHSGLLQAFGAYQRQGGSWGLQLVGSGPLKAAIAAQIRDLPDPARVQLQPFAQLEELGRLYGQASAFVLASSSDQWGLVVNEAMAAGLPCLVSSACGCAVDLIEHGSTGWCFDPAAPGELTALFHAAEQQSAESRQAMMRAARQRLEAFTPASFAHGLSQAVNRAISQPRFSRRAALAAQLLSLR